MPTQPQPNKHRIHADHIVLALSALMLLLFAALEFLIRIDPTLSLHAAIRALILVLICLLLYCGALLLMQRTGDSTLLHRAFYLFFFLYLYLLLSFTLIDPSLGRNGDFIHNNVAFRDARAHYMKWFVNLVPFRSIYEVYILGFVRGYVSTSYMLFNLLGNLCAFMPFAFFLPLFFPRQRRWYLFIPTILSLTALIEVLQLIFMRGSCDIDDLILNAGGAVVLYFVLRIPVFRRVCAKLLKGSFA